MAEKKSTLSLTGTAGEVWKTLGQVPCSVVIEVPIPRFTVRNLLNLETGDVLSTIWSQSRDLPVRVNGRVVGWCEFEVVNEGLVARVTELA